MASVSRQNPLQTRVTGTVFPVPANFFEKGCQFILTPMGGTGEFESTTGSGQKTGWELRPFRNDEVTVADILRTARKSRKTPFVTACGLAARTPGEPADDSEYCI